jgi:hypothetical protein
MKKITCNDYQQLVQKICKRFIEVIKSSGEQIPDSQIRFFCNQVDMCICKIECLSFFCVCFVTSA